MKKKLFTILLLAVAATSAHAQKFALQSAVDNLLNTKDLKVVEQVKQQNRDSNDSLCSLEVIVFSLPYSRRDVFQGVQQAYSSELSGASGGYSRVVDLGSDVPAITTGTSRVSLYYLEGREPLHTGEGNNFVCIRHNLPNPMYRTVVCIEWWKEMSEKNIGGRIITIQGPIGPEAYAPRIKYSGSLQYLPSATEEETKRGFTNFDTFGSTLDMLKALERLYQGSTDERIQNAIVSSFSSQLKSFMHLPSHENEDMKEVIRLLDKMPGYGVEVYEDKTSADGDSKWEPQHMTKAEIIEKYESFPVLCLSWCEKGSPEAKAYGEGAGNGLLQIFLDK